MLEQFHPRGVMMRDCLKNRAGYDRVLMAVAATFLTVSATSAVAQNDPPRNSAAELAIDAAVPRPEPANIPPPTASDFKADTTGTLSTDAPKVTAKTTDTKPAETKPADVATAPVAEPAKVEPVKSDTATVTPAEPPAAATPAAEPVKAASNVPAADQPVADKLRDMFGAKSARYFDRKAERAAVEKFYTARDFAPLWTQSGSLTGNAKGVIARLKDAASDGLNPASVSGVVAAVKSGTG
jgi:murein L,D-transpeptidase YcbB/YkuD